VSGGETEAAGERGVLGGEEWFEDTSEGFLVHADASIRDGENRAAVGNTASVCIGGAGGGGDSQLPTLRHGGACVVGQLHQDDGELVGIDEDGRDRVIEV